MVVASSYNLSMFVSRFFASVAVALLLLASLASFCNRMGTAMFDTGETMQPSHMMSDCAEHSSGCPGDFMQGLLQSVPMSAVSEIIVILLLAVVTIFVFSFLDFQQVRARFQELLRQRLKRLQLIYRRPALLVAFSRGILHSKRYA
jgi:hypothetical protein